MPCDPLFPDPFVFPQRPVNRPGLARVAFRIGRYADFREAIVRGIDAAPELAAWTHRRPDDPAIALVEGAAIVGDILSFYQELYVNEAYLRTAAWRDSVAELVRLTGYRLAPGIGGRATLAFEARGAQPVTIRERFPVKVELSDLPAPAEFETDAEIVAWPHLGRFNLFRARHYDLVIASGASAFELASVGEASDSLALEGVELKKGDRLLLIPEENLVALFLQAVLGWNWLEQPLEEIVVVDRVERTRGRVVVTIAGSLTHGWPTNVRAFRLGRTWRHYGAAAPPQFAVTSTTDPPKTTVSNTLFKRQLRDPTALGAGYSPIEPNTFPLDQEVTDLAAGATVIVTGTGTFTRVETFVLPFAVRRGVTAVRHAGPRWGNLSTPASFLRLDSVLAPAWADGFTADADLRTLRAHETRGPELRLRPVNDPVGTAFTSGTNALQYYGTAAEVQALAGRRLYLSHADGRSVEVVCTSVASAFATPAVDAPQMWPLSFDRAPLPFTLADFDEAAPTVTAFANLVDASQGKAEREAVLGNGNHRQRFQTFPLPKAPLTYFLTAGAFPPHTPELEVRVAGRLWTRVDTFFGRRPTDEIYIVREDAEGRSFVQFGDGENGALLPSGLKNVTAVYRSGVGARGSVKAGTSPSASERPIGFDKVSVAGIVSGGADPEDLEKAREAAPGKVQSLGRLVSIEDYRTETLSIPGVVRASATWDLYEGAPAVVLRVLLEAGREAEFAEVQATIAHAQRCSGPDRFALIVEQAMSRFVFLDVTYARDPAAREDEVVAALRAALGLFGDSAAQRTGLFGLRARELGEREYASRIEGRLQNVAGVLWCKVDGLGVFASGVTDPATLVLPAAPRPVVGTLPCAAHELLQLADAHLTLTASAEPTAGACL